MGPEGPAGRPGGSLRLGVLLSGGGRTLENLMARIRDGSLPAEVAVVVSSHPEAYGLERALRQGLRRETVDFRSAGSGFSDRITEILDAVGVGLVVMAREGLSLGRLRRMAEHRDEAGEADEPGPVLPGGKEGPVA